MLRPCINYAAVDLSLPLDEQIKMLHDAGFRCIDFNIDLFLPGQQMQSGEFTELFKKDIDEMLEFFKPYKETFEKYEIEVTQAHAPFQLYVDGKDDIMLSDAIVYNLNVADSGIYYFGEKNDAQGNLESVSLYKMDLDGKNNTKIYTLEEYSNTLCLLKDWVFFLDSSEEEGRMELVSNDGKQKITLFSLRYEDYYYLDEIKERTEAAKEAATTTETEVETVPETNDQQ